LSSRNFLQTEESDPDVYHGSFARLVNCETTGFVHLNLKHTGKSGIWIDISVLDNIYEDGRKRRHQLKKIRHYQRMLFAKTYKERDDFPGTHRCADDLQKADLFLYNRNDLCMKLKKRLLAALVQRCSFAYIPSRQVSPLPYKWRLADTVPLDFEWMNYLRHWGMSGLAIQYGD
jgi:hypothetical protein